MELFPQKIILIVLNLVLYNKEFVESQNFRNSQRRQASLTNSRIVPENSCPLFFEYVQNQQGIYSGRIKIKFSISEPTIIITVHAAIDATISNDNTGVLEVINPEQNIQEDIAFGRPLLYRMSFPLQQPLPRIISIHFNDSPLCSSSAQKGNGRYTEYQLQHILNTGLKANQQKYKEDARVIPKPENRLPPQQSAISRVENNNNNDFSCGRSFTSKNYYTALVINGTPTARNEFPWIVAFYNFENGKYAFTSGGTLVSPRAVVTAAHCIQNKYESRPKSPQNGLALIGAHNLEAVNQDNSLKQRISNYIVHPDWKPYDDRFDADIAILILQSSVSFSDQIQPICLWNFNENLDRIVGLKGFIVGWGTDENLQPSLRNPKKVDLPIVSEGECLRSNPKFNYITSDRTFCAGARDGRLPCQGDSGGGFIMKGSDGRWYLRGIISAALTNPITGCDTSNFAVFTDAAKFTNWVKQYV